MGKTVHDLAETDPDVQIAARCDLGDSIEPAMKNCDVAIDFTQPDSIDEICRAWAKDSGEPFVTLVARHGKVAWFEGLVASALPIAMSSR